MISASQVSVDGLRDLHRALRRMDAVLAKDLRNKIKGAAQIVADEAKRRAPVASGSLRRSIRAGVISGETGVVRASATRKSARWPRGYRYPYEIEYGGRLGTERTGPRAFLTPALEAKSDEVTRKMEQILDDLAASWED